MSHGSAPKAALYGVTKTKAQALDGHWNPRGLNVIVGLAFGLWAGRTWLFACCVTRRLSLHRYGFWDLNIHTRREDGNGALLFLHQSS
jgi:hypothetical protein